MVSQPRKNAHPHCVGKVALVHNGIIENYRSIKVDLIKKGCVFTSTTDTETIAHFINIAIKHCSPEVAIQSIFAKNLKASMQYLLLLKVMIQYTHFVQVGHQYPLVY